MNKETMAVGLSLAAGVLAGAIGLHFGFSKEDGFLTGAMVALLAMLIFSVLVKVRSTPAVPEGRGQKF